MAVLESSVVVRPKQSCPRGADMGLGDPAWWSRLADPIRTISP